MESETVVSDDHERPVPVSVATVDADSYSGAVPGVQLKVTRTGLGSGPNVVASYSGADLSLASARVQFPVLGRTEIADDVVAVAQVTAAPSGTRWCGHDLEPGTVLVYGPGAVHTGVSPVGVKYSFVVAGLPFLQRVAEELGRPAPVIERGQVDIIPSQVRVQELSPLQAATTAVDPEAKLGPYLLDEAVRAVLTMIGDPEPVNGGNGRGLDSRRIVNDCLDQFSPALGVPSIRSMCLAAHVSGRRRRNAFVDVIVMPPQA
jgi:hypothetical protein